jgi:hypothetical protein
MFRAVWVTPAAAAALLPAVLPLLLPSLMRRLPLLP